MLGLTMKKSGGTKKGKRVGKKRQCHNGRRWTFEQKGPGQQRVGRIHVCDSQSRSPQNSARILSNILDQGNLENLQLLIAPAGLGVTALDKPLRNTPATSEDFENCKEAVINWYEEFTENLPESLPFGHVFGVDAEAESRRWKNPRRIAQFALFTPKKSQKPRIIASKRLPAPPEKGSVYVSGEKHGIQMTCNLPVLRNTLVLICHDGTFLGNRGIKNQKEGGLIEERRRSIMKDFARKDVSSFLNLIHYDPGNAFTSSYNQIRAKKKDSLILSSFAHSNEENLWNRLGRYYKPDDLAVVEIVPE